jgi:DNA-binding response OmpR family regulator
MDDSDDFNQRVLVVDDDPAIQQMFTTLLKRQHISSDVAADGDAALRSLRKRDYAAILLDLMLPRTNGFEVIRHLKCLQPHLLHRVIVVTAASERTLECLDTASVRTVLRKPFDINELVAEVRACLAQTALVHDAALIGRAIL